MLSEWVRKITLQDGIPPGYRKRWRYDHKERWGMWLVPRPALKSGVGAGNSPLGYPKLQHLSAGNTGLMLGNESCKLTIM